TRSSPQSYTHILSLSHHKPIKKIEKQALLKHHSIVVMSNTAMIGLANMARVVPSSRSTLRASAPNFQFRTTTPFAASSLAIGQAAFRSESQENVVTNGNVLLNAAPNTPAAMPGTSRNPGAGQQGRLPARNWQSNRNDTSSSSGQSNEPGERETDSPNERSATRQSKPHREDISPFQRKEYHDSTEKYWPDEEIVFKPSKASFAVALLARRLMASRQGTDQGVPMPMANELFNMYKNGDLEAAQQSVVCTDNNCQCGPAIGTLQHKVELQQEEARQDGLARCQLVDQCSQIHEAWQSAMFQTEGLTRELAAMKGEKDQMEDRANTLERQNQALLQRYQELEQRWENIEGQEALEQRKTDRTEEFQRKIAESQALAAEQAPNRNAGKQATEQAQNVQTRQRPTSATKLVESIPKGENRGNGEGSNVATPTDHISPTPPTPSNSLRVQFTQLPDGGLTF
ncbi:hypothetical protein BKA64DRAFT_774009, partial [Cadophora sp. MPI-SDFR-AT-0126]